MEEKAEAIHDLTKELMRELYPRQGRELVEIYYTNDTIMHLMSQLTFFVYDISQGEIQTREKYVMQPLTKLISVFWDRDNNNSQLYFAAAHLKTVLRDTFLIH